MCAQAVTPADEVTDVPLEAASSAIAVSVVLPSYNEAENIAAVIAATQAALRATPDHEIVVVDDDSPDETWRIVENLNRDDARIRCCRRIGKRGLASAIFDGLAMAQGDSLVVMDADLQHDPGLIPELVAALGDAELVVASRYAPGGSTEPSWSATRRWASRLATALGRWALRLTITDPMSGFFAIRSQTFRGIADRLRPRGFKALLEILSRAPKARVMEIPYNFGPRQAGASKLGNEVILEYLLSLIELRTGRVVSARFIQYCLVGLTGVAVQLLALVAFQSIVEEELALALAIFTAMVSNFVLNNVWTFRDQRLIGWAFAGGLLRFVAVSAIGAVLNHTISLGFHRLTGVALVWSSLTGIAVATLWNYQLNRYLTWRGVAGPR